MTISKATIPRLRDARERMGYSQFRLAARAGVSMPIITRLEKGLPTKLTTARLVAATRPAVPILALSAEPATIAGLCLTWGVLPRPLPQVSSTDELFQACRAEAVAPGLARPGDRIVVTAGVPLRQAGTTNLLKVLEV